MQYTRAASKLNTSVLVLNRYYMAVHVVTARRAFILLYRDLAEVIYQEDAQYSNYDFTGWCEMSEFLAERLSVEYPGPRREQEEDNWIHAVNFNVRIPQVIRLLTYDRAPRQSLRFNRRNLFARDEHRCQYCGRRLQMHQLSLDHVIPRSRGGKNTWENVVSACIECNTKKGSRTPHEARMRLMRRPVKPNFNPLFRIKLANPKFQTWKAFLPQAVRET